MNIPIGTETVPLSLPLAVCTVTASYLNPEYRKRFGFNHYGVDLISNNGDWTVLAQGTGKVLAAGVDETLGGYLVVEYDAGMIGRYFHLAKTKVSAGQQVSTGDPMAEAGNTGKYTTGRHLHVELDKDLKYPFHTPTLGASTKRFFGARDGANSRTMVDPLLYMGMSVEQRQAIRLDGSKYSK